MGILEIIFMIIFILFMVFLVVGFNHQMNQKAKLREDKFQKGDKNE